MNLEFHYNGGSKKKMVASSFSIDNILTEFKSLFDVKSSTLKLEDFELNLVNNDGGFIKLQNTSQLFNGAVIDIQCLNDEGLINNQNDNKVTITTTTTINDENKNDQNGTLSLTEINDKFDQLKKITPDDTDIKEEYPQIQTPTEQEEEQQNDEDNTIINGNKLLPTKQEIDNNNNDDKSDNIKQTKIKDEDLKTEEDNNNVTKDIKNGNKNGTNITNMMHGKSNSRYVVRLRGLPWSARETEITEFFGEEELKEVQIVYLTDGRASGEALVEFSTVESFQSAFLKNRQHIGHRYIEIFKSTGMEIDTAAGRAVRPPARPPKSQYVIRMRGLPYSATDEDVMEFFDIPRPTGIHLIKDDLGRPSGEGFVEFATEVDAIAAMAKHRHHMGHRYIELFRSSPEELMRALGLTTGWYNSRNGGSQPKSTCILMRGLPYSCTESDITKFFQEIDVTPIRIHRKADGAEAYVEFYSISDTDKAMTRHRNYIGRRYIELFRVTYEDMARTVGLPVANTNIPASIINSSLSAVSNGVGQNPNGVSTTPNGLAQGNHAAVSTAAAIHYNGAMVNSLGTTTAAIMHAPLFGATQQQQQPNTPSISSASHYPHSGYPNGTHNTGAVSHHNPHQYQTPHSHGNGVSSYPHNPSSTSHSGATPTHTYHSAHSGHPSTTHSYQTPSATQSTNSHLLLSAANINALMNPLSIYNNTASSQQQQQQQQQVNANNNASSASQQTVSSRNNHNSATTTTTNPYSHNYANYNNQQQQSQHKTNPYLVMNHGNQTNHHYQQRQSQQYYQPQYYQSHQ